jgi:hypothetical protein
VKEEVCVWKRRSTKGKVKEGKKSFPKLVGGRMDRNWMAESLSWCPPWSFLYERQREEDDSSERREQQDLTDWTGGQSSVVS